jgi:hypothetical protein
MKLAKINIWKRLVFLPALMPQKKKSGKHSGTIRVVERTWPRALEKVKELSEKK